MKKVYRLEIEVDDSQASGMPGQNVLHGVLKAHLETTLEGFSLNLIELRTASIPASPIRKSTEPTDKEALQGSSYRSCNTEKLLELINMDPLCDAYKDAARRSQIDRHGQHLLQMIMPFVNAEASREIFTHRVEVNAKMTGTMQPYRFFLEIPAKRWNKLRDIVPLPTGE